MKKIFLMLSLLLVVCMVSGCAYLPLLYAAGSAAPTETTDTITPQIIGDSGDTVTISKEEYEKYQKFATFLPPMTRQTPIFTRTPIRI